MCVCVCLCVCISVCVCVCTSSSEGVSKVTSFKVNISLWKAEFPGNAGSLRSQPSLYFCCLLEGIL